MVHYGQTQGHTPHSTVCAHQQRETHTPSTAGNVGDTHNHCDGCRATVKWEQDTHTQQHDTETYMGLTHPRGTDAVATSRHHTCLEVELPPHRASER
eukprot:m.6254 g.6254  ORF g.6254 m.6254 type:complete len:97 (-) comp4822_c0_seq1:30-320(-)